LKALGLLQALGMIQLTGLCFHDFVIIQADHILVYLDQYNNKKLEPGGKLLKNLPAFILLRRLKLASVSIFHS